MVAAMPRPDAAAYLATRFHRLRHPDGTERRFEIFNSFGQPDKVKQAQKLRADHAALAMINELELAGYTLVHRDDAPSVDAIDQPGHKIAKIVCSHCGRHLGQLKVRPDLTIQLASVDQQALAQLPTTCDEHKALTNA
jgi:hypothetical protein